MAPSSESKDEQVVPTGAEDDMPEHVAAYKKKLERETGKKYKYRPAKKDMPSIPHMLAHGAPEDANRPRSWLELIGYPLMLVLAFVVSFAIFQMVDPIKHSKYPKGRFALPRSQKHMMMNSGNTGDSGPTATPRILEKKPKVEEDRPRSTVEEL